MAADSEGDEVSFVSPDNSRDTGQVQVFHIPHGTSFETLMTHCAQFAPWSLCNM